MAVSEKRKTNPCTIIAVSVFLLLGFCIFLCYAGYIIPTITDFSPDVIVFATVDILLYLTTGLLFPVALLITTKIDQKNLVKFLLLLSILAVIAQVILSIASTLFSVVGWSYYDPFDGTYASSKSYLWSVIASNLHPTPGCAGLRQFVMTCINTSSNMIQIVSSLIWGIADSIAFLSTIVCALGFALRLNQLKKQEIVESPILEETEILSDPPIVEENTKEELPLTTEAVE